MPDLSPEDVERAVRALEIEDECGLCHGEGSWWSDCGDSTCDCDGSVTQCPRCAQTGRARRYPKNYAEAAERIPHVLAALAASLPQREPETESLAADLRAAAWVVSDAWNSYVTSRDVDALVVAIDKLRSALSAAPSIPLGEDTGGDA